MPEELKPLLEKLGVLEAKVNELETANKGLKESIQRVTDLNRALLDKKVDTMPDKGEVLEKFNKFMKGE